LSSNGLDLTTGFLLFIPNCADINYKVEQLKVWQENKKGSAVWQDKLLTIN
jgi:hypothetical protein